MTLKKRELTALMIGFIDEMLAEKGAYIAPLWVGLAYQELGRPSVSIEKIESDDDIDNRECIITLGSRR